MAAQKDLNTRAFAVRSSLGISRMDARVQIATSSASPMHKPVTYRLLSYLFLDFLLGAFLLMASPMNPMKGGWLGSILFTVGYVWLSKLLLTRSDTLDWGYLYPFRLLQYYVNDDIRMVSTGKLYDMKPVYKLFGITPDGIREDGTIIFINGEIGYLLSVVGYASTMLFAEDQRNVLESTQVFYRNLPTTVNVSVFTRSQPQDVTVQLNSKLDQLYRLKEGIQSPGLSQIVKAQARVLRDVVGKQFSVTSQYMMIRGDRKNVETVLNGLSLTANSSGGAFLKSARRLKNERPRYNSRGELVNREYEVDEALRSILDLKKRNN